MLEQFDQVRRHAALHHMPAEHPHARTARAAGRPCVWMLGGHVMKCGVSPYLVELLQHRFVTHFASNGSLSIHDVEVALFGRTSEDVADTLERGIFGMVRETPGFMW